MIIKKNKKVVFPDKLDNHFGAATYATDKNQSWRYTGQNKAFGDRIKVNEYNTNYYNYLTNLDNRAGQDLQDV
jgi:hypothetical protein